MDYEMPIGSLPVELEEITPDVLNAALAHRFQNPGVRALRIEEAHHGFSTVLRVHLDTEGGSDLPKSIIYKGQFEEATKVRGRDYTYKSLEMEYHAFNIMPGLGLNMPEVFFKQMDPGNKQMMILMEDLALRDVAFQHGLRPNTVEQVRRRLTALADFHSRTWGSPELAEGGRHHFLNVNGASMFVAYMDHAGFDEAEWEKYIAMPRGQACPRKMIDYHWMRRILLYAATLSDASPNCLIHGDTHLGNLYEDAGGGEPGFFDPLIRREHGMLEATYHIANALDPIDRRAHDRDLVAHYRDELIARGIAMPSLAETMHQYAAYLSINLVTFLLNHPTYQTEAFNTAHAVRAAIAMMDNNSYDVV